MMPEPVQTVHVGGRLALIAANVSYTPTTQDSFIRPLFRPPVLRRYIYNTCTCHMRTLHMRTCTCTCTCTLWCVYRGG